MSRNAGNVDSSIKFLTAQELAAERDAQRLEDEKAPPVCTCAHNHEPYEGPDGHMYISQDPGCRVHPASFSRWVPQSMDINRSWSRDTRKHAATRPKE